MNLRFQPIPSLAHALVALAGMWVMASPAAFGYAGAPAASDQVAGPIVATCGIIAMWEVTRPVRWLNAICAAWMLVAAVTLNYPFDGRVNALAMALAVGGLSLIHGRQRTEFGGGWSAVFKPSR